MNTPYGIGIANRYDLFNDEEAGATANKAIKKAKKQKKAAAASTTVAANGGTNLLHNFI